MEDIRKPNGKEIYPPDHIYPGDETIDTGQKGANIDMAPARDNPTVGEYRSEMMRATLAMEAAADAMKANSNGKSKGPIMMSVAAIVFTAGGLVANFTMKTSTAAQDHEETIRMKVLVEADSKKLDALDEYLRDIREDLAAHGLLNKGGSNANSRK